MKFIILMTVLSLSQVSFANTKIEFDEAAEKVCYEEAKKAGCVKGDNSANSSCVKARKSRVPTKCHQILGISSAQ